MPGTPLPNSNVQEQNNIRRSRNQSSFTRQTGNARRDNIRTVSSTVTPPFGVVNNGNEVKSECSFVFTTDNTIKMNSSLIGLWYNNYVDSI